MLSKFLEFQSRNLEPTRNFSAEEDGKDEKRIIEGYAHVFWAVGLESNGGIDTAGASCDICRHEVICASSVYFPFQYSEKFDLEQ